MGSGSLPGPPPLDPAGGAPDADLPGSKTCVPEICNGRDDNCDGVVDEGCPAGVMTGNATERDPLGDSQRGSLFADTCSDGELLVGINVTAAGWLDQVAGICKKYVLTANTKSIPYQYSLTLSDKRSLSPHPPTSVSAATELMCSEGTAMVGLQISQQHTAFGSDADEIVVPQISVDCAQPILDLSAGPTQKPGLEWANVAHIGPVSGLTANNQAWFETDSLVDGQVLVGLHGAAGTGIDRIGLIASPFAISLNAE